MKNLEALIAILGGLWIFSEVTSYMSSRPGDSGRSKYLYPPIDARLLYKTPTGFCFGRDKKSGKYVCYAAQPPKGQGDIGGSKNVAVIGGSGSGKSSALLIPGILGQYADESDGVQLIVDIKCELSEVCARKNDLIFNPQVRYSTGYDPLYALSDCSTTQEIYVQMQLISISLLPASKNDDGLWTKAARQLLTGFLVYLYKKNIKDDMGRVLPKTLPNLLKYLLERDIDAMVKEIKDNCSSHSLPFRFCQHYLNMGTDTKMSVDLNLRLRIQEITSDEDLVYSLSDNPVKFSPKDLVQYGKGRSNHIFLAVPEDKLEQYSPILFMVFSQVFHHILGLPEAKSDPDRKSIQILIAKASRSL